MTTKISIPPQLDIDREMEEKYGHKVGANGKIERRIVNALIRHMNAHGFVAVGVWDGEELGHTAKPTLEERVKAAMELIFNLDEASLRFVASANVARWNAAPVEFGNGYKDVPEHGVLLVLGNGEDIVSDWNYTDGDPDGFNAAMGAFDAEAYV